MHPLYTLCAASLACCLLGTACHGDRRFARAWEGREIVLSEHFVQIVNDSVALDKPLKVVFYTDSTSCAPCQLQMTWWKQFMAPYTGCVSFLFIVHQENKMELTAHCRQIGFDYPLLVDKRREMQRLNHFPKEIPHRCFLIDSLHRVLVAGHPLYSQEVRQRYEQVIRSVCGAVETAGQQVPRLAFCPATVDLGTVNLHDTVFFEVHVTNPTDSIFELSSLETSCECTSARMSGRVVAPGDTLMLYIQYIPDTAGDFLNVIDLYDSSEKPAASFQFSAEAA